MPTNCQIDTLQYTHLAWTTTALGVAFLRYDLERSDDSGLTFNRIAEIALEATITYDDYESLVGVMAHYRIRSVRTDLAVSTWTTVIASALQTEKCEWLFTTNADPTLNVAFNVPPEIEYQFLSADETVFMRIYGRDYQVAFSPTEERGVAFQIPVTVYASQTAPAQGVDGVAMFNELRALATADVPYVCVRDYRGNRFFAHLAAPSGSNRERHHAYIAAIGVTEITGEPATLDA